MISIGKYNRLKVVSINSDGATVSDGRRDLLMPKIECDESVMQGAELDLFVFRNSKDKIVATTRKSKAQVGDFVALKVVDSTSIGAFLDWGLSKDLFVPKSQMLGDMVQGHTVVVHVVLDDISNRIVAIPRLRPFLAEPTERDLPIGTKVKALVYENRENGTLAVVNNKFKALFPAKEFSTPVKLGTTLDAFVKLYDEHDRAIISRAPVGREGWSDAETTLLELLDKNDGFLPLNDKSSPLAISTKTGMSKKSFKKVVGGLFKRRKIEITDAGIRLIEE